MLVEDGKHVLAVQWWGDPHGSPVVLMHGMPGSRIGPRPRGIVLERMGIRLISYDRPGYGSSTRRERRTVADAAGDVERIADALGIGEFSVVGRSAGGPHALACAARLPHRVTKVALLVTVAPPDAAGLDWDRGMSSLNVRDYAEVDQDLDGVAVDVAPLARSLDVRAAEVRDDPETLIAFLMPELTRPDRRVIENRSMRRLLTATYAEAVREGSGGWIDDAVALRSPWRVDFSAVACPVLLWHGVDDQFSPVEHTHWLAGRLRAHRSGRAKDDVVVRLEEQAAHFAAFEVFTEVLAWLVEPYQRPAAASVRRPADRVPGALGYRFAERPRSDDPGQSIVRAAR